MPRLCSIRGLDSRDGLGSGHGFCFRSWLCSRLYHSDRWLYRNDRWLYRNDRWLYRSDRWLGGSRGRCGGRCGGWLGGSGGGQCSRRLGGQRGLWCGGSARRPGPADGGHATQSFWGRLCSGQRGDSLEALLQALQGRHSGGKHVRGFHRIGAGAARCSHHRFVFSCRVAL